MTKIFVLGSLNSDMVISAPRIPQEGETLHGENFFINLGGKGANQAVMAANAGAKVFMLGAVGDDDFGVLHRKTMGARGINTKFLQTSKLPTGTAMIIKVKGNNRIILNSGANFDIDFNHAEKLLRKCAKKGDILMLQQEIKSEVNKKAIRLASELKMNVHLNPAPASPLSSKLYKHIFLISPNETEAEILTGQKVETKKQIEAAIFALHKMGCQNVVITLGKRGCAFLNNGKVEFVLAAISETVIDTTGAGDTFVGTIAAMMAEGKTLKEAIKVAAKASSITITRNGAYQSFPLRKEILD